MINLKQSGIPRGRMNLWKPGKPERARGHARKKRVFKKGIDPVEKGGVKNSQRRNHARGPEGRPGPETQGSPGQTAGQSGKASAQGDGPAGGGGPFRRRYAGTQSLYERETAERREAGSRRNLPGNLAVAQGPALRKAGEPPAHQPVRHGRLPVDPVRTRHLGIRIPGQTPHHQCRHRFPLRDHEPELHEAGEPDLVPDLPGGEGELLCGVLRQYASG